MKDFSDPLGHALPFVKPSGQNILTQSDISNQLQLALSYFKVQQSCFMAIRANKNLEGGQQERVRVLVLSNDVQVITSQKNEIVPGSLLKSTNELVFRLSSRRRKYQVPGTAIKHMCFK